MWAVSLRRRDVSKRQLENRESLADAVLSAAKNAVEDNIPDYLGDLMLSLIHI